MDLGHPNLTAGGAVLSDTLFKDCTNLTNTGGGGALYWLVPSENSSWTTKGPTPQSSIRNQALARAEIGVLGLVFALTALGNGFVLWVLLRRRKHHAPMHLFMVNLCVADLVVAFFQVFIFSRTEVSPGVFECWGHFAEPWGLKAYVTWMTLAVFILPACIITVCQVRIFKEIHDNIYLKSEKVVMAEFKRNSVLFHIPHKEGHRGRGGGVREGWSIHSCHPGNSPTQRPLPSPSDPRNSCNSLSISSACDPCSVPPSSFESQLTPSNGNPNAGQSTTSLDTRPPHLSTHRHSHSGITNPAVSPDHWPDVLPDPAPFSLPEQYPPLQPAPGVSKAMSKTVRMTLVIVLVYTFCWSPFFIVQLWAAWDPNPPDQGIAFTILMLLASLNSCTNPWIYTAFSSSVSRELVALLHCRRGVPRRGSLPDDSTTTHTSTTTKDSIY
ncbi:vasopressin V2 receptor isoform X2 [Denticeps clupeoides]|uniref:vasopressin V2 receptor isoform X2 n=1 Tax=Denticeps clupeoides TaxID=299321 RepID=UPI0010A4A603|nr:vasopressin V2 receptor-like isoform X2 [Denticeps clupeoides]